MITNVSGRFEHFEAAFKTEEDDFTTAQIEARIKTASINTNNTQRDAHLRNSDFFEVEKHPEILFNSTKVEKIDNENLLLYGNLTMKGISKPVTLAVAFSGITKDPWGNERVGFTVQGKLNRKDWGVNYNALLETGGVALGEEVKINAEIQMVKQIESIAA